MTKTKLKRPRFLQHIIAFLGGYFWRPCPLCGQMFGGHEEHGALMRTLNNSDLVCADCIEDAKERNEAFMESVRRRNRIIDLLVEVMSQ